MGSGGRLAGAEVSVKAAGLCSEYIGLEMAVELLLGLSFRECQPVLTWLLCTEQFCTATRFRVGTAVQTDQL